MREKTWHHMIAARYKAIYLSYFNSYIRSLDRWLEVLLVITSSGAVAGWLLWTHVPWLWAAVIGAAQLVKVIKPFLPFLKEKDQLAASYVFYEQQHHAYEQLWDALEFGDSNEAEIKEAYERLKDQGLQEVERTAHFRVPEWAFLVNKTERLWSEYLRTNHQTERQYE